MVRWAEWTTAGSDTSSDLSSLTGSTGEGNSLLERSFVRAGAKPSDTLEGPIIEARSPMRAWCLQRAVLLLALAASLGMAQQKKSPVNGAWDLRVGSESYRIAFVEEDGDVRGTVTLPNGETTEIEYGLIFGDELEFLTVEGGVEHEWTAKVSRNSIKGERVNLDEETTVRFTAKRAR